MLPSQVQLFFNIFYVINSLKRMPIMTACRLRSFTWFHIFFPTFLWLPIIHLVQNIHSIIILVVDSNLYLKILSFEDWLPNFLSKLYFTEMKILDTSSQRSLYLNAETVYQWILYALITLQSPTQQYLREGSEIHFMCSIAALFRNSWK